MKRLLTNKRGSAIIMALLTMTVLVVLGMAVITLSMGTLTTNVADATTNHTYYAAEAGVNSAIEQVKKEVAKYYADMSEASGGDYTLLYDGFFQGIASRSNDSFVEPMIEAMTTITTFGSGNVDEEENTGDILISCEAIAVDGTKYVVNGSVSVLRIDLRSSGKWFFDVPVYAGGTLHVTQWYNGVTPSNSTIVCNRYTPSNWAENGGDDYTVTVDENAAAAIGDFIPYPSYSDPALNSNVKVLPSGSYLADVNAISQGIIYCQGNLTINAWAPVYKDIYCDGILTISGTTFSGNIYCRGDLFFSGGGGFSGNIICDGNIDISGCNRSGFIMAGGFIKASGGANSCSFYAVGSIDISGGSESADGGVIYSCTDLRIKGGNSHGIYFSGGDIFANNGTTLYKSALIAKGTIHANWLTLSYDQSYIDSVQNDPNNAFFFGGSGSGGSGGGGGTPTSDVIKEQSITAMGRIN